LQTPSDWGTPHPGEKWQPAQQSLNEAQWSANVSSGVCIHGLPSYTTEQDVCTILRTQSVAQHFTDIPNPVVFLEQSIYVPVKSAIVCLQSSAAIHVVQQALQGMQLGMYTLSVSALLSNTTHPEHVFGMTWGSSSPRLAMQSEGNPSWQELREFLVMDDSIHEPIDFKALR